MGPEMMTVVNVLDALRNRALPLAPVHGAPAEGAELYRSPDLGGGVHAGVDVLVVPPHAAFPVHTHPGHHVLYVVDGEGTVMYEGEVIRSRPGDFIVIPAEVVHNVAAGPSGQVILSIGAPHHRIDSHTRMTVKAAD